MRPRFEADLRTFNEVAKDDLSDSQIEGLSSVIDWHLEKVAERQRTSIETQEDIYEIQKQKQEIMQRLKDDLICLDDPECKIEKKEGERLAVYDGEKYFAYEDDNGSKWGATFGEIMTDMQWDVFYHLDKASTPRHMMKKYLVEKAKKELHELLDRQIIKSETESDVIDNTDKMRKDAYRIVLNQKMTGESKEVPGFISEIIVRNFLNKLSIDEDLPFTIKEADVFQDVAQKIDFIIRRKERGRGVGVEADKEAKDIGVQFTTNKLAKEHKEDQVRKSILQLRNDNSEVQDIALVIFPIKKALKLKNRWQELGRPAGGPDRYLEKQKAELLFKNLLRDIFTEEEIDEYWQKVQKNFE